MISSLTGVRVISSLTVYTNMMWVAIVWTEQIVSIIVWDDFNGQQSYLFFTFVIIAIYFSLSRTIILLYKNQNSRCWPNKLIAQSYPEVIDLRKCNRNFFQKWINSIYLMDIICYIRIFLSKTTWTPLYSARSWAASQQRCAWATFSSWHQVVWR